ncbi:PREDICTED: mucin-3B-like [Rhinopithecus bieti]|uniref:mucin-3B-like n=1 Tax=Rhinopithecus bieti TaxID=61621 RepID=UPI00083C2D48|nr:PREDICTED: mucin-3B-like [Rhinopithecus bieti]
MIGGSDPAISRSCYSTDTHWFSGPRCEVAIHWRALVGGLTAGAALLLLLLLALGVWAVRSGRWSCQRLDRSWAQDRKWFETWDEEIVGTFSNWGFEDDGTDKDENFHVALEKVDTTMKVHIKRPEMTSSSV